MNKGIAPRRYLPEEGKNARDAKFLAEFFFFPRFLIINAKISY